jgi:hypothetical protein
MAQWKAALAVVATSSILTLLFVAGIGWTLQGLADELRLPLLIVAAVAGLLTSLALIVAVFALYQLADRKFALGLPDGSIRAVVALLLIVLFSALTIFLTIRLKQTNAGEPVVDFAKQLLTILGTLMTSVTSFYFGSRAVSDGTRAAKDNPTDTEPSSGITTAEPPLSPEPSPDKTAGKDTTEIGEETAARRDIDALKAEIEELRSAIGALQVKKRFNIDLNTDLTASP